MIRKILGAALMTTALMTGVAQAKDTIVWWDFLSGGDGVRLKAMLDEFNKEHANTVEIQATTLEWGCRSTPRCRLPRPSAKAPT